MSIEYSPCVQPCEKLEIAMEEQPILFVETLDDPKAVVFVVVLRFDNTSNGQVGSWIYLFGLDACDLNGYFSRNSHEKGTRS